MNTLFVKVLREWLDEKYSVTSGNMANYTRTTIQMSILRAASMCVRCTRKRFISDLSLLGLKIIDQNLF